MSTGVFLIQDNGKLSEMKEQRYDSEAVLQTLLAEYPNLLTPHQVADGDAPLAFERSDPRQTVIPR